MKTPKQLERYRAYQKKYREEHRPQARAYWAQYYENNQEDIINTQREYMKNNAEKIKKYYQDYSLSATGKRSKTLSNWRFAKLTPPHGYTLEEFYDEIYLPQTSCQVCGCAFKSTRDKQADHDHNIVENNFRFVLCQKCNIHDNWKKHSELV
jgi:hypothetical protein